MKKLDQYECRMIRLFKSGEAVEIQKLRQIWAERCDMQANELALFHITNRLLEVAQILLTKNWITNINFIQSLEPSQNWRFICANRPYISLNDTNFNLILLSRLNSLFEMANVTDLPGYEEWLAGNNS